MAHSLAAIVYAEQLRNVRHGEPLWQPEPSDRGEVQIGDVGYIEDGRFQRLFNAVDGSSSRDKSLPETFKPLLYDAKRLEEVDHQFLLPMQPQQSESIVRSETDDLSRSDATDLSRKFKTHGRKGAVAVPYDYATSCTVRRNSAFTDYIRRHHYSWYKYATSDGRIIQPEDLVLVSGWVKTSSWSLATWVTERKAEAFSLSADHGSSVHAHVDVERTVEYEVPPNPRYKLPQPGQPHNQCLFVRYYKAKYRPGPLKLLGMKTVVPVRPIAVDTYVDADGSVVYEYGGEMTDEDEDVIDVYEMPESERLHDPVEDVLDHILETNPTVEMAITCHDDLFDLFPTEWPSDFPTALKSMQRAVAVDGDGVGVIGRGS